MSSRTIQPIKLWGQAGANPPKIRFILEELEIPYNVQPVSLKGVKEPAYLAINPNGRLPAIHDPNTNLTLWESGAIIEYLVDRYDKDHKVSFDPGTTEAWHAKQWLFFQVSGQGPYFGQAVWFKKFHKEILSSAVSRYVDEIIRVTHVLEGHLSRQQKGNDGPWLVGNKFSFADAAFLMWQNIAAMTLDKTEFDLDAFPLVKDWMGRMSRREKVKWVLENAVQPLV